MKIDFDFLKKTNYGFKDSELKIYIGKKEDDVRDFLTFKQYDGTQHHFAIEKLNFDGQKLEAVLINGNAVGWKEYECRETARIQIEDRIILDPNYSEQENIYRHLALSILNYKSLSNQYRDFGRIQDIYEMIGNTLMSEKQALETAFQSQKVDSYFDIPVRRIQDDIQNAYKKSIWTKENVLEQLDLKVGDIFLNKETNIDEVIIDFKETLSKNNKLILSTEYLALNKPSTIFFTARNGVVHKENNDWLKFDSKRYKNENNYKYVGNIKNDLGLAEEIILTQSNIQRNIWVLDNPYEDIVDAHKQVVENNDFKNFEQRIRELSNAHKLKANKYDGIQLQRLHKGNNASFISIVCDFESYKKDWLEENESLTYLDPEPFFEDIKNNLDKLENLASRYGLACSQIEIKKDDSALDSLVKQFDDAQAKQIENNPVEEDKQSHRRNKR